MATPASPVRHDDEEVSSQELDIILKKKSSEIKSKMAAWLFVGLGNPGTQYALNRHNVGFMAVDVIADHLRAPAFKIKSNAALTETVFSAPPESHRLYLLKPQTFMNLSARAVAPILSFYKIPLDHLIVFHDELD